MKLLAQLCIRPGAADLTHVLLATAAAVAAFWMLGAFVQALHVSIRQGEALREQQRSGATTFEVAHR